MSINLYAHAGSSNHGCEAIVRSTVDILNSMDVTLFSNNVKSDKRYGIDKICVLEEERNGGALIYNAIKITELMGISNSYFINVFNKNIYKALKKDDNSIYMSIGGDNYCDGTYYYYLAYLNKVINKMGKKTVLWGCSIEPEIIRKKSIKKDLERYSSIVARESITYKALIDNNVKTKIYLKPDPAFCLKKVESKLSRKIKGNGYIGINISPLIIGREKDNGIILKNYNNLVEYILSNTDYNIIFIPHVLMNGNNDLDVIEELVKNKRNDRIIIAKDYGCEELKGIISECEIFIGARTHSTIAAYSTCVPTLVVGYSVKSKGIAKDLFGTYENYVLPIQNMKTDNDLCSSFQWIERNKYDIKMKLKSIMPKYIEESRSARNIIIEEYNK